jgi:hypothetical protein
MHPFKYTPPRVRTGDLRTWVVFYLEQDSDSPLPDQNEKKVIYECWSKVDEVWSKDIEIAKANGTLSDLTLTIRDPLSDFTPTNLHFIEIQTPEYKDLKFNVKRAFPDLQNRDFIKIIAEVTR